MLSRRWIHCSFPVRNERSLAGVGLGVCIGLLLGICFSFESRTDVEQKFVQQYFPAENRNVTERDIWIRCVVLVQPGDPRPHKYVRSILDTYAKRCNRTIFFTKEEKLLPKFHGWCFKEFPSFDNGLSDEADIYALNNFHELTSYSFFHLIMQLTYGYSQKDSTTRTPPPRTEWIIFLNEQNFLVPENLRLLVKKYDSTDPVMFGRLAHSKWLLTYLFPFLQTETFQLDAGVLVSRAALEQIATSDECQPHWFLPAHTGKGLYACASKLNIATIDPIDGVSVNRECNTL